MNILQLVAAFATPEDCPSGSPTINTISKTVDTLGNCIAGWDTTWQVNVTGTLLEGQEYYWEIATNAAGDNWAYLTTTTGLTVSRQEDIGTDGGGASTTKYVKVRAYVVPVGGGPSNACSGPVTSEQASRTANSCVE